MVKDSFAQFFCSPRNRISIRIPRVIAAKHFVTIARRIEEIDCTPSRDPVPGRPNVYRYIVHPHDVCCVQDLLPAIKQERRVMKFIRFWILNEGNIVRLV